MNRSSKFVAAVVAVILFGAPFAVLASCSPKLAMASHCGGELCPMMQARQKAGLQLSETPSGDGSCCQMSNQPAGTMTPGTAPEGRAAAQVAELQPVPMAAMAFAVEMSSRFRDSALPISASPQALLCTFLV